MIRCDVIDDNSIALMIDASYTFGDILPILYDFATIFAYFICECDNIISRWMGMMMRWNKNR